MSSSGFTRIGEISGRIWDRIQVTPGNAEAVLTLLSRTGQPLLALTHAEAAERGLRCRGHGDERRCQLGLWRDSSGEWVYAPEKDRVNDPQGYKYREAIGALHAQHKAERETRKTGAQRDARRSTRLEGAE